MAIAISVEVAVSTAGAIADARYFLGVADGWCGAGVFNGDGNNEIFVAFSRKGDQVFASLECALV